MPTLTIFLFLFFCFFILLFIYRIVFVMFGCSSDNISLHLKNIFASNELERNSVTEKSSAAATAVCVIV